VDLPFAVSPVIAGLMLIVPMARGLSASGSSRSESGSFMPVPGMVIACLFVTMPFVVRRSCAPARELGDEQSRR